MTDIQALNQRLTYLRGLGTEEAMAEAARIESEAEEADETIGLEYPETEAQGPVAVPGQTPGVATVPEPQPPESPPETTVPPTAEERLEPVHPAPPAAPTNVPPGMGRTPPPPPPAETTETATPEGE